MPRPTPRFQSSRLREMDAMQQDIRLTSDSAKWDHNERQERSSKNLSIYFARMLWYLQQVPNGRWYNCRGPREQAPGEVEFGRRLGGQLRYLL